ncbi:unnamed protein product [Cuscuta campestris]|uniref:CCT domain-containing protein n=1 Tax=Cuscuta campestris TaxID=132261 RepID=A0A484L6W1_9ASTE|nr:unnamed protein product [Cuscuta campestris]
MFASQRCILQILFLVDMTVRVLTLEDSDGGKMGGMSTISTESVSSVDSSRTFVLGKRRKNKRQSYDSKERYQRAHRKAQIAKIRIWKRRKAPWERDDPEETFSVDSANSICGAGGDNPPVDSARLVEWEWVAC